MAEIIHFSETPRHVRVYTDWRALRAPLESGRFHEWNARTYLPETHNLLEAGSTYTLEELAEQYGLPRARDGSPYLLPQLPDGRLPDEVTFVVEPLG